MSPPQPEPDPIGPAARVEIEVDYVVDDDVPSAWDQPRLGALISSIVHRHLRAGPPGPRTRRLSLSLHLVGDPAMRELNVTHRGIDASTDVLSFSLYDADDAAF